MTTSTRKKKKFFGPPARLVVEFSDVLPLPTSTKSSQARKELEDGHAEPEGEAARLEARWQGRNVVKHVRAHPVPERHCVHLARGFPHRIREPCVIMHAIHARFPRLRPQKSRNKKTDEIMKREKLWSVSALAQRFFAAAGWRRRLDWLHDRFQSWLYTASWLHI